MVKNSPANAGDTRDVGLIPGLGRSPGERKKWKPMQVFLPRKVHGQRNLVGYIQSKRFQRVGNNLELSTHTHILFSIVAIPIYIPTNSGGMFPSLHTLFRIYCLYIFDDDNSDWHEMIPQYSFDLHFCNN